MNESEYSKAANELCSDINNSDQVRLDLNLLLSMVSLGDAFDRQKRATYYQKTRTTEQLADRYQDLAKLRLKAQLRLSEDREKLDGSDPCLDALGLSADMLHALMGLTTEIAEMWEVVLVAYADGKPLNLDNLHEEMGDHGWYDNLLMIAAAVMDGGSHRFNRASIRAGNLAKLKTRAIEHGVAHHGGDRDIQAETEARNKAAAEA